MKQGTVDGGPDRAGMAAEAAGGARRSPNHHNLRIGELETSSRAGAVQTQKHIRGKKLKLGRDSIVTGEDSADPSLPTAKSILKHQSVAADMVAPTQGGTDASQDD